MSSILLILHIFITIALIIVILIQRSNNDGFGLGGGMGNVMSGRASANFLTKTTSILAALFILNSLALAVIASSSQRNSSIIDVIEAEDATSLKELPATGGREIEDNGKPTLPVAE